MCVCSSGGIGNTLLNLFLQYFSSENHSTNGEIPGSPAVYLWPLLFSQDGSPQPLLRDEWQQSMCLRQVAITHGHSILPSRWEVSLTDRCDQNRKKGDGSGGGGALLHQTDFGRSVSCWNCQSGEVSQGLSTALVHCLLVLSTYALCGLLPPGHRRSGWICTAPVC